MSLALSPDDRQLPLSRLTTLRLGGPARALIDATSEAELVGAVLAAAPDVPLFVLGGGSNLVVADAGFDGIVVKVSTTGVHASVDRDGAALVSVAAGESWDEFVADCVGRGLAGLETLSGIPGTVGAAPIQNIGAYGQAAGDRIVAVDVLDRASGQRLRVPGAQCGFGYRDSRFKRDCDRFVVLSVSFKLPQTHRSQPVTHRELAAALDIELGARAPLAAVRQAVLAVRARKGMVLDANDHDTWSAGSFFINPVLEAGAHRALLARTRATVGQQPPAYPELGGASKVPAAWLIDHAGFGKGYPLQARPDAGIAISTKHPLALTNRGHGSSAELIALAEEIVAGVERQFGVRLTPEPRLLGF